MKTRLFGAISLPFAVGGLDRVSGADDLIVELDHFTLFFVEDANMMAMPA